MHVWTKPIWWNHRGRHDQTHPLLSVLFCFSCLFKRLRLFPNNTSGSGLSSNTHSSTKTTKPPTCCQNLRPASLSPRFCVSHSSEWGNGAFYCVILPLRRKGEDTREQRWWEVGGTGDKANFVLCGFSVVSESSPTLPPAPAPCLSQLYFLTQPLQSFSVLLFLSLHLSVVVFVRRRNLKIKDIWIIDHSTRLHVYSFKKSNTEIQIFCFHLFLYVISLSKQAKIHPANIHHI